MVPGCGFAYNDAVAPGPDGPPSGLRWRRSTRGLHEEVRLKTESSMARIPASRVTLTPNALTVLRRRYLKKGPTGKPIETPTQMFWRVAENVAQAERRYGRSAAARTRALSAPPRPAQRCAR